MNLLICDQASRNLAESFSAARDMEPRERPDALEMRASAFENTEIARLQNATDRCRLACCQSMDLSGAPAQRTARRNASAPTSVITSSAIGAFCRFLLIF